MSPERIRVVIADDHTLFRDGLRALFASIPELEVVGEAADGREAIAEVKRTQPDVVLMDIQMPDINGIEATRALLNESPDLAVIVVTMLETHDTVFAALRAGARGYVLKEADQDEMLDTIQAVAAGEAFFGPAIAQRLMAYFSGIKPDSSSAFPELTQREAEVLEWIAQGRDNGQIARSLNISRKTVRNHVSNILSKLQVADRAEAIIRARRAGMGDSGF